MAAPTLKFKRGALADLPSLAVGEPGFTTDRYQLYVGSDDGNKFIGANEFWTLNTTTAGSGVRFLEGTNNGSNYVQLQSPANVASNITFELPGTDASASGQVLQSNASGTLSFGEVALTNIDIDGGTDIGAAIVDADLFIVDDGASGTNRKTAASRLKTYVLGGSSGASFSEVTVGSAVTINNSGIDIASGVVTATTFDGNLTGNVTGTADKANQVSVVKNETAGNYFFTFVDSNNVGAAYESLYTDTALNLNPSTTIVSGGGMDMVAYFINSVEITSTATELNVLDGITATTTELNYTDGVTSNIQTQLDAKGSLTNQNSLITLSGVSAGSDNLGSFTGTTISDDTTVKNALQELETELETVAGGGAQATSIAVGATDTASTHYLTFVPDNNVSPTQENLRTDAGVSYNPSTNNLIISGDITANGNIVGDNSTNISGISSVTATTFVGSLEGTADVADNVSVTNVSTTNLDLTLTMSDGSNTVTGRALAMDSDLTYNPSTNTLKATNIAGSLTGTASTATNVGFLPELSSSTQHFVAFAAQTTTGGPLKRDTGLQYQPSSNTLTATNVSVTGFTIGGTDVTATATELNVLDGVTAFLDEDNMASDSATAIPSQQSVKAYVDGSVAGVAVTFEVAADSGTADIFQTGSTLTFSGTAGEVDTAINAGTNTLTFGLPATVNITTELDVPTIETGAVQAKDGTASFTIADSTGKVTSSADVEVQGTFTATSGAALQGNTDIGDANTDTLTVAARIDSNLVPTPDATRNLGSPSFAWHQGHIDHITGIQNSVTGVSTAGTFKGTTLDISGNGSFNGNVTVTGNLSVGGSVTNVDIEDLRVVSPVIELGLQRLANGSLQPPASVTTKNSGITMYYNHVGVSSANAKVAAMFAKIGEGQDMRIGFATDVVITSVGAGDSVASVNAWADIEAKGLWINDCAGQSQVISCSGSTRNLENITVDGGAFT